MSLVKRLVKGSPLTFTEGDNNLQYLEGLATNTGSFFTTSSFNQVSGSFLTTSSFNQATGSFVTIVEPIEGIIPIASPIAISAGATTITYSPWAGRRLLIMRDGFRVPSYDPGTGAMYYTKATNSSNLVFSVALAQGEDLFIAVI